GADGPPGVLASAPLQAPCIALEKKRLTEYSRYRRWVKRLGDQKCRLRPFACHETLRVGCEKYDRHLECPQHLIHSIEPRATISELNVSQNYSGPLRL